MLLPSGNLFKCHEEVLSLQPMIPPKRFDIFTPDWGMRSDYSSNSSKKIHELLVDTAFDRSRLVIIVG